MTLESAIEQSHAALAAIFNGDTSGFRALFSQRDDVTLGNPFGPFARGRSEVEAALARAASHYQGGDVTGSERIATYSSGDLACVVEVVRGKAKVGGSAELLPVAIRMTSLFRKEGDDWKLVHRHADPITTPRPASSVISSE